MTPTDHDISHNDMANAIRALAMDAVEAAKSGHPGMPMGCADIATVLFTQIMRFDPARPDWPDRDRFILSAGHGSMLLYALGHLLGYPEMTLDQLRSFRQLDAITDGHPEHNPAVGIETTTGPLGQGLANAVGFTLAERLLNARFGDTLVDHFTYVLASDGDLMEGLSHEAASFAGHQALDRLIVLWDDNRISIDGSTELSFTEDVPARFAAYGWDVNSINGHDPQAIRAALTEAKASSRPSLIACRTTIGYGAPNKAGTAGAHGAPLGDQEIAGAREALGWPHAPFEIPDAVLAAWREAGRRGAGASAEWQQRLAESPQRGDFEAAMNGAVPTAPLAAIRQVRGEAAEHRPTCASRKASGNVLDKLAPAFPALIGGSADLSGSNNTRPAGAAAISPPDYNGNYIHYGVREHGMAAAMNGMALHGGIVPYGGTFLVFSDYCRPAIRLAALMRQRVIFVMTHDSIGLGEDGPTHQPVEHLAALRAIPNLHVFRPADAVETAECWEIALQRADGPSLLALSRQGLPTVCSEFGPELPCARGGYVMKEMGGAPDIVLIATGSEVTIALEAARLLAEDAIGARVVSLPCRELFLAQDPAYRESVLGTGLPRIGIEAAGPMGWDAVLGPDGRFIGMTGFGASGPAGDLYEHFGITAAAIAAAAKQMLVREG